MQLSFVLLVLTSDVFRIKYGFINRNVFGVQCSFLFFKKKLRRKKLFHLALRNQQKSTSLYDAALKRKNIYNIHPPSLRFYACKMFIQSGLFVDWTLELQQQLAE